jgi:hypothetical protein
VSELDELGEHHRPHGRLVHPGDDRRDPLEALLL